MFCSCSNNKENEYSLTDLSNPLLDEWFANFKAADSSFLAGKFEPLFYSDEFGAPTDWYDFQPMKRWEPFLKSEKPNCMPYPVAKNTAHNSPVNGIFG
jgi:hypothetical protein